MVDVIERIDNLTRLVEEQRQEILKLKSLMLGILGEIRDLRAVVLVGQSGNNGFSQIASTDHHGVGGELNASRKFRDIGKGNEENHDPRNNYHKNKKQIMNENMDDDCSN